MQQVEEYVLQQSQALVASCKRRGRPARLSALHLCLGIVLCGLEGFGSQLQLWRRLCLEAIGPFTPVLVVDQAIYNRLARAARDMRLFFEQAGGWMAQQLVEWEDGSLAPWASQVLAGDPRLLAGRISALFDVRRQQWVRVELWQEAVANGKQQARLMLEGLPSGTLLLFDRGYLSFPWFDELTERGLWWISRYANHANMQVRHIFYQGDGVLDAIVWLGRYRADRATYPVRLVQFYHHGQLHRYLTNVLDPQQLSVADLARLYARRWDIELGISRAQRASAGESVVERQMGSRASANLGRSAAGATVSWSASAIGGSRGGNPFEVSIDLLVQIVPRLLTRGIAPLPYLGQYGREVGLIRPSTRLRVEVPLIDPRWITPAPPEACVRAAPGLS